MTEYELDFILTIKWPSVMRLTKIDRRYREFKGFAASIAKQGRNPEWKPSAKQERLMRRLLAEL